MAPDGTAASPQVVSRPGFDFGTMLQIMGELSFLVTQVQTIPVGGSVQTPPEYAVHVTLSGGKRYAVTLNATRET